MTDGGSKDTDAADPGPGDGADPPGKYLVDRPGLYAVVVTAERRHWQFRYIREGRDGVMSLGPIGPVTLEAARKRHLAARAKLAEGDRPAG